MNKDTKQIMVNGDKYTTRAESLNEIADEFTNGKHGQQYVVIINGYQTGEDLKIKSGDEITIIEKGKMPSEKQLQFMMSARNTPGVYERLRDARVAVAGLGGLGSSIALQLARTGIGYLHLIDFDVVEPSNLNRQQYRICDLGMNKTDAMKKEIKEINPYIKVVTDCIRVDEENILKLFNEDEYICEAFDNPEAKAVLVNGVLEHCPDKIIVAASGMAGFESSNSIVTKKITDNFYICGDGTNGSEPGRGLMAPRVTICAGHQSNMILRLILGKDVD